MNAVATKVAVDSAWLNALRAVRLYHWTLAISGRAVAKDMRNFPEVARIYNRRADQHIQFVQTLNGFFAVGDTAEKDAEDTP